MTNRIIDVVAYVSEHYDHNLRLEDVAAQFFISPTTLSRNFKKETGRTFSQYIAELKSAGAASDLIRTNLSITQITKRNGYSSPSQFTQAFKQRYGITPKDYRKRYSIASAQHPKHRTITIDAGAPGDSKKLRISCNIGDMLSIELGAFRRQLELAGATFATPVIRLTNMFAPQLLSRDDFGKLRLNFDRLDDIFDYLVSKCLTPIVELSSRTQWIHKDLYETLRTAADSFRTTEEADTILRQLITHLRDRYGQDVLQQWRFELRYNYHLDSETPAKHAKAFAKAWFAAKQICPVVQFGGSGVMLAASRTLFPAIIAECQRLSITPDFLSAQSYVNPASSRRTDILSDDIVFVEQMSRQIRRVPLVISEWNLSISERNAFNDTAEKGAEIIQTLVPNLTRDIDVVYSSFSDLTTHYYDTDEPFCGGSGVVSKDGFRKPSFHALAAMASFPRTIISSGPHHIVGRDDYGNYRIVAFNPTGMNADYFAIKEYEVTQANLQRLYNPGQTLTMTFRLTNLEAAKYLIRSYLIDESHGNSRAAAEHIAADGLIQPEDFEYVNALTLPDLSARRVTTHGGVLTYDITLEPHAFVLIKITPQ